MESNDLISSTQQINCLSKSGLEEIEIVTSFEVKEQENQKSLEEKINKLFENLQKSEKREEALLEISKMEETCKNLATYIFYSSGTLALL